jgi:hypothetical protein
MRHSRDLTWELEKTERELEYRANGPGIEVLPPSFDYAALPPAEAAELRQAADRIRVSGKRQVVAIIETGRELIGAKGRLRHGQFGEWIAAEFSWSESTARNYMNVAEAFGAKSATVEDLPPRTLYALAAPSTPAEARETVIARIEQGDKLTSGAIQKIVETARLARRRDQLVEKSGGADKVAKRKKQAARREARWAARLAAEREARERETAEKMAKAECCVALIAKAFGNDITPLRPYLDSLWWQVRELLLMQCG